MSYWWTTEHWQDQYAMEVNCQTDISLNTVKSSTQADDTLRYVPAWLGAKKKGRPKENVREKSVTDIGPLINLGTQHDGRSARTWMKRVLTTFVLLWEGEKDLLESTKMDFL